MIIDNKLNWSRHIGIILKAFKYSIMKHCPPCTIYLPIRVSAIASKYGVKHIIWHASSTPNSLAKQDYSQKKNKFKSIVQSLNGPHCCCAVCDSFTKKYECEYLALILSNISSLCLSLKSAHWFKCFVFFKSLFAKDHESCELSFLIGISRYVGGPVREGHIPRALAIELCPICFDPPICDNYVYDVR